MNRPSSANAALAASRTAGQVVGQRTVGVQAAHQLVEQVGATVLGCPPVDLRRDLAELSPGRRPVPLGGVAQRLLVPPERGGHGRQSLGDVALRLLALVGIRSRMPRTFCSGPAVTDTCWR
jgi:hypothetical protein